MNITTLIGNLTPFFLLLATFSYAQPSVTLWPNCNNDTNGRTVITARMLFPDEPAGLNFFLQFPKRVLQTFVEGVNDRYLYSAGYEMKLEFLGTGEANQTKTRQHIRDILRDDHMLAHLFALGSTDSVTFLEERQDVDGQNLSTQFSFIAPTDPQELLRKPFKRNVINVVGSSQEEISALIRYATDRGASRFGAIDSVAGLGETLNATLSTQGRRLIVFREIPEGLPTEQDMDVISSSGIQALFISIRPELTFEFLQLASEREALNDVLYLVPSLGGSTGALASFLRGAPELANNVISVNTFPPWDPDDFGDPFSSLNALVNADIAMYDPNVTIEGALYGYTLSPGTLGLAASIEWFARILASIKCSDLTRTSIVDQIYQIPSMLVTTDTFFGTFRDDEFAPECNQGASRVILMSPDPINGNWIEEEYFTWDGCTSLPENAPVPVLLGSLSLQPQYIIEIIQKGLDTGTDQFLTSLVLNYRPEVVNNKSSSYYVKRGIHGDVYQIDDVALFFGFTGTNFSDFPRMETTTTSETYRRQIGVNQSEEELRVKFAQELTEIDNVPLFFGFEDEDLEEAMRLGIPAFSILDTFLTVQDSSPVEGPFPLRTSPIRLFPDLSDRLYAVFSKHSGGSGIVVYDPTEYSVNHVQSIVDVWEDEFSMSFVRIESLGQSARKQTTGTPDFVAVLSSLSTDSKRSSAMSYKTQANVAYLVDTFKMDVPVDILVSSFPDWIHVWTAAAVGFGDGVGTNESNLLDNFFQAKNSLTNNGTYTPLELTSYYGGLLIARVLVSINGQMTPERLFSTLADLQVFSVDNSLSAGPYSEECSKGGHSASLLSGNFSAVLDTVTWSTCGAQREADLSDSNSNGTTRDIVISVVVIGVFLVLCVCCALLCCLIMIVIVGLFLTTAGSGAAYAIRNSKTKTIVYSFDRTPVKDYRPFIFWESEDEQFPSKLKVASNDIYRAESEKLDSERRKNVDNDPDRVYRLLGKTSVGGYVAVKMSEKTPRDYPFAALMCYGIAGKSKIHLVDQLSRLIDRETSTKEDRSAESYKSLVQDNSVFIETYKKYAEMNGLEYAHAILIDACADLAEYLVTKDIEKKLLEADYDKKRQLMEAIQQQIEDREKDSTNSEDFSGTDATTQLGDDATVVSTVKELFNMNVCEEKLQMTLYAHKLGTEEQKKMKKKLDLKMVNACSSILSRLFESEFPRPIAEICYLLTDHMVKNPGLSKHRNLAQIMKNAVSELIFGEFLCNVLQHPVRSGLVKEHDKTDILMETFSHLGLMLQRFSRNHVFEYDPEQVYKRKKPIYDKWLDELLEEQFRLIPQKYGDKGPEMLNPEEFNPYDLEENDIEFDLENISEYQEVHCHIAEPGYYHEARVPKKIMDTSLKSLVASLLTRKEIFNNTQLDLSDEWYSYKTLQGSPEEGKTKKMDKKTKHDKSLMVSMFDALRNYAEKFGVELPSICELEIGFKKDLQFEYESEDIEYELGEQNTQFVYNTEEKADPVENEDFFIEKTEEEIPQRKRRKRQQKKETKRQESVKSNKKKKKKGQK